jgi:hypothetical protein
MTFSYSQNRKCYKIVVKQKSSEICSQNTYEETLEVSGRCILSVAIQLCIFGFHGADGICQPLIFFNL